MNTLRPLTRAWHPLRPHADQMQLWGTSARFVGVAAGRRAGKTDLSLRRLVRMLPLPPPAHFGPDPVWENNPPAPWTNPRYFYGSPTHKHAKRIAWDRLKALVPPNWVANKGISESDLRIKTIFGSELWIFGLDKPERIEGDPWDFCVVDESSDVKPKTFDRSIRPALSDRQGGCWRIGVPKRFGCGASEYRTFWERCRLNQTDPTNPDCYPDGEAYSWPASDILDAKEVAHAKATLDLKDYREQYDARWETAGGQIFYAFDFDSNKRACSYDPTRPILVGSDFNVDPMAWVLCHLSKDGKTLECFDQLWLRDCNTARALDVLWQRYGQQHASTFEFYGDASSSARKTSASTSDYSQILNDRRFRDKGAVVRYPRSNPLHVNRFAACNAMFLNAAGERRCFVDHRCTNLLDDLRNRAYKEGSREPDDYGDVGHITDALSYIIHMKFPIRVAIEGPKPKVYST